MTFCLSRSDDHFLILCDGEEICRQSALPQFFQDVEWTVTAEAMARLGRFLQLHGGAVQTGAGDAVLIVGGHGAGKTTLTVALAQRGATILTDEVALVDPQCLEMTPFRRDLILHAGTQALFPELMQNADTQTFKTFEEYRYVSPLNLGGESTGALAGSRLIVFPRRCADAAASWKPLGSSEVALRLLEQAFNLGGFADGGIEVVARMAERCTVGELVYGDPREAAEVLSGIEQ